MNKKIKVLLIGMSSNIGGIETYLFNLVRNNSNDALEFAFLVSGFDKIAFEDELKCMGVKIYKIIPRNDNYFKHIKELKNIIKKDYDYIHFNIMSYSWFEPIYYAKKYKKKIIIHSHNAGFVNDFSFATSLLNSFGKHMIKKYKTFNFACGDNAGIYMFGNNFVVMNNGINVSNYTYNEEYRDLLVDEFNLKKDDFIVGNIAKLESQKNPLFLIDVFYEIQKLKENSKLVLVGVGSLKEKMLNKIDEYGIKNKVIFAGKRLDANKFYSLFDAFVMPSLYEGFSISLIEAQASGLKCYTSTNVDIKTNITGNVEFVSLDLNAEKWARTITFSDNKRDLNAYKIIKKDFDQKKCYQKLYDFYLKNITGGYLK